MAGDWIKMRCELQTHPKIVRILSATKADKFRVIGGLHAVWSVFDAHSTDGVLFGYTPDTLDHVIGWDGFSKAMISVGWLIYDGAETLSLPEFDEHNGKSGKRRAEDQKRKRNGRKEDDSPKDVRNESGQDADKKRTREEKSESKEEPPIPPKGGNGPEEADVGKPKRKAAIAFQTFLDDCKDKGEKAIPDEDSVFAYADDTGIPIEFLRLHWLEFKERYIAPDAKRYKDWRSVYRKSVRGCWFKLWFLRADGTCGLTTQGEQAKRHHGKDLA